MVDALARVIEAWDLTGADKLLRQELLALAGRTRLMVS